MTTQGTWRPNESKQPAPPPKEVLEAPRRRWPKTLIAVAALLLGIGLGNAFFGGELRMDSSLDRLEALTEQLDRANAEIARLRAAEELPPALVAARAERAAIASELDQAIVDGTSMFAAGLPTNAEKYPASPVVTKLLDRYVTAANDGAAQRLLSTFTPDGVLTLMAPQVADWRVSYRGTRIGSDFLAANRYHLRLTSPAAEYGSFAWARYAESADEGVMVVRLQGNKIAHVWFVAASQPVGIN